MKHPPKQRSPYQMGVPLNELVWDIFEKVWTQRNEILHNTDNYTSRAEATNKTNRLLQYKRHRTELVSPSDCQHPEIVIINWKTGYARIQYIFCRRLANHKECRKWRMAVHRSRRCSFAVDQCAGLVDWPRITASYSRCHVGFGFCSLVGPQLKFSTSFQGVKREKKRGSDFQANQFCLIWTKVHSSACKLSIYTNSSAWYR